jgi:hypothetical protein
MNWNLEKMRLLAADRLKDISAGDREKMVRGMKDVPAAKMIDAVNFIDKNLLPAVKKKSGDKSADYEFFTNVIDYLLWAIVVVDRYDTLEARWVRQRMQIALLQEQNDLLEKELLKYTTLEDLYFTSSLDAYAQRIKEAAADRLTKK